MIPAQRRYERFFKSLFDPRNKRGQEGAGLEFRHGVKRNKNGVWDCNDRAEIARRYLERDGYTVTEIIECTSNPKVNHVFVRAEKEGVSFDLLRVRRA